MKKSVFKFLDQYYGKKIYLVRLLFSNNNVFLNESNERLLSFENLGHDGEVVFITKVQDSIINFFPISRNQADKIFLEWFITSFGSEKNNSVKKIFEEYKDTSNWSS